MSEAYMVGNTVQAEHYYIARYVLNTVPYREYKEPAYAYVCTYDDCTYIFQIRAANHFPRTQILQEFHTSIATSYFL